MKFLVLGSSGMAGHVISLYLKEQGHDVLGFDVNHSDHIRSMKGDAKNLDMLNSIILDGKFDVLINCIGILNQFAEEKKELAVFLNSYLPHYLASVARSINAMVIHMSTDCVFSGNKGGYKEYDLKDGISFYDRTKALGELDDSFNLTFRNSIIGPDIHNDGIGLFNWFMKQRGTIYGFTKAIWTGVTTITLAKAMEKAAQLKLNGLYNLVNSTAISKYDLLKLFNEQFKNSSLDIIPSDSIAVDKSLVNQRTDFDFIVPSYKEMVIEMKKWINEHKYLYPHYF